MSTRMQTLLATAAAMAMSLSLGAFADGALAQGPGGPQMQGGGMKMFGRCDTDGNGQISRDEFEACRKVKFEQVDANKDGKATFEEFQAQSMARKQQRQQMMFQQMDANGDGTVTADEFDDAHESKFEQMDTDGDGAINQAEAQQMRQKMRGQGAGGGPGQGKGPGAGQGVPGQGQGRQQ